MDARRVSDDFEHCMRCVSVALLRAWGEMKGRTEKKNRKRFNRRLPSMESGSSAIYPSTTQQRAGQLYNQPYRAHADLNLVTVEFTGLGQSGCQVVYKLSYAI